MKILVVDDDLVVLEVTRALLEGLGHVVVTRDSALGTAAEILRERPDVVLVDVQMPALTGDKLVEVIRDLRLMDQGCEPAIILYSGESGQDLEKLAQRPGVLGYIEKTGDLAAFASAFQDLVRAA